ncbi:MAG: hypothetical protein V3S69_02025 [Dehalococcoidales bacterium]
MKTYIVRMSTSIQVEAESEEEAKLNALVVAYQIKEIWHFEISPYIPYIQPTT